MTVAAFDNGKWYRAEVNYLTGSDVFVLLIDFSKRKYLKPDNLRYLEKTFAVPPRMSVRGSLFGVKPKTGNGMWSVESILGFLSRTEKVKLSATLKGHKDGIYQLALIDENCLRIENFMLEQGLAEADKTVDSSFNAILVSSLFFTCFIYNRSILSVLTFSTFGLSTINYLFNNRLKMTFQ